MNRHTRLFQCMVVVLLLLLLLLLQRIVRFVIWEMVLLLHRMFVLVLVLVLVLLLVLLLLTIIMLVWVLDMVPHRRAVHSRRACIRLRESLLIHRVMMLMMSRDNHHVLRGAVVL